MDQSNFGTPVNEIKPLIPQAPIKNFPMIKSKSSSSVNNKSSNKPSCPRSRTPRQKSKVFNLPESHPPKP